MTDIAQFMQDAEDEVWALAALTKARVKAHQRKLKDGRTITVKEHERKDRGTPAPAAPSGPPRPLLDEHADHLERMEREARAAGHHGHADRLAAVRAAMRPLDDNKVRAVIQALTQFPSHLINIADVRDRLGDAPRAAVDDALKRLYEARVISLHPNENLKSITDRDRASAIRLGETDRHLIAFDPHAPYGQTPKSAGNFATDFDAAFTRLVRPDFNRVTLHDLRSALPQYSRAEFDKELNALRRADRFELRSSDGRHRTLTTEERAAAIDEGDRRYVYVSRRAPRVFADDFDAAFDKLRRGREFNMIELSLLRKEMPHLSREEFDAGLHALRRADRYELGTSDGRHRQLTPEEIAGGIEERGRQYIYVSRRSQS